jgi:hypothetical protein
LGGVEKALFRWFKRRVDADGDYGAMEKYGFPLSEIAGQKFSTSRASRRGQEWSRQRSREPIRFETT